MNGLDDVSLALGFAATVQELFTNCPHFAKEATTLIYHAPSLTDNAIAMCSSMRELTNGDIGDADVDRVFSCLISLFDLFALPNLESICSRALPFPSLKILLYFRGCPKLKKLPPNSSSSGARQLSRIEGQNEWWYGLLWDDPDTK
ncbi:hypothetical protein CRG98_042969 [Punica granatum]|uniref:Uncharacterized protein n=1 Tax=Punica granatum TaxID=22663 RepID=A0A2I0HYE6_PUNGR|nr:hypothetical protein CRG98_042969 [Punica granatum]